MIASSVTHISDELEPNKVHIGTHVHVLFITNYVKYITYFKVSILPKHFYFFYQITKLIIHFPVQFNYVKIMKYHYL